MRFVSSVLAASTVLLCAADPVNADPSTTSRLSWVTNGDVQAAVQVGNTLYIGGTFTRVAPAGSALGSFFGVSTTSGDSLPSFPLVDGIVHAVEPDGAGGFFIGGEFTRVGGAPRTNLAHVIVGGTIDAAFAPIVSGGPVRSLALGSSTLFVGGTFAAINAVARDGFATVNPTTGALIALPPPAFSGAVKAQRVLIAGANVIVLVAPPFSSPQVTAFDHTSGATVWSTALIGTANDAIVAGSRVIVCGRGLQPDGRTLASLDLATGVIDASWAPSGPVPIQAPYIVTALAATGNTVYVGGTFTQFGGQQRTNAAAVHIPTGTVSGWAPTLDAPVSSVATTAGGTVILSGRFTQVDGAPRDTFAEVDAGGYVTPWVSAVRAGTVQKLLVDGAGGLIVGGQVGVSGGSARTNLAAFDLSSDTLLPWAPEMSDDVTRLAASGSSIYIGASRLVAGQAPSRVDVVSAVDNGTGATLPWTPPSSTAGVTLLGSVGPHVYLSGVFGARGGLIRVDPTTAAIDPSWLPQVVGGVRQIVVSGTTMFIGGGFRWVQGQPRYNLAALDLPTGTLSPWDQTLLRDIPGPTDLLFKALAIDGRTLYVAYEFTFAGIGPTSIAALDTVSGLGTAGGTSGNQTFGAIEVTDGQLIVGHDAPQLLLPDGPPSPPPGGGVQAFTAHRQLLAWNPGYSRIKLERALHRTAGLVVTPTDLIVLGYNAAAPVPVQGVAVLPRTPSAAPTSLRATTLDNQVTLTWNLPSTPPPSAYIVDVGSEPGSSTPVSISTGNLGASITAIAGNGRYYARVRAGGAAGPASVPTNEIALVVGCSAAPSSPPLGLTAHVNGSNVTLTWMAPPFTTASRYLLEAGSSSGATDIIPSLPLPFSPTAIGGLVSPGTYFVRLRAANACGASSASSDIFFTIGSASAIPAPPTGVSANVTGSLVAMQWTPSAGASGYIVEAGSTPGLSNIATLPVSASSFIVSRVPNGTYYLRVRAGSAAGLSAPSSEFVLVVAP